MPSLTLPDRLIWFAHCPKAGGTSIEQIMVATWGTAVGHLHWGWDLWWRGGGWRMAGPANSPQHLIWQDACALLPQAPDLVFALVRAPLARMQSERRWQARGRRGTLLGKAVARLPFSIWLRLMLEMRRRNPYCYDNHFRAQTAFVPENAQVFRLEDGLDAVVDWLGRQTGRRLDPPPHALATPRETTAPDPRDAALVAQVFAEDHRRFGYRLPDADVGSRRPLVDALARAAARALVPLERRGLV